MDKFNTFYSLIMEFVAKYQNIKLLDFDTRYGKRIEITPHDEAQCPLSIDLFVHDKELVGMGFSAGEHIHYEGDYDPYPETEMAFLLDLLKTVAEGKVKEKFSYSIFDKIIAVEGNIYFTNYKKFSYKLTFSLLSLILFKAHDQEKSYQPWK